MPPDNGWSEWSKYVLKELERLNICFEGLDKKVDDIKTDITMLKVKAAMWGALGSLIAAPIIVIILVKLLHL